MSSTTNGVPCNESRQTVNSAKPMISSMSSPDRAPRTDSVSAAGESTVRAPAPRADRISTRNAVLLQSALARQPEIRPEVVERARALAEDPHYPSIDVIKRVAQQILRAPDLSEDET
jgi:hypothetical protein